MRILADENCGGTLMSALIDAGHDVKAIVHIRTGMDDEEIFALANAEGRVLLTHDLGFGLMAEQARQRPAAILLMRMRNLSREVCARIVVQAIAEYSDSLLGHFVVIGPVGIRARAYKN